jgi:hypothetical protein
MKTRDSGILMGLCALIMVAGHSWAEEPGVSASRAGVPVLTSGRQADLPTLVTGVNLPEGWVVAVPAVSGAVVTLAIEERRGDRRTLLGAIELHPIEHATSSDARSRSFAIRRRLIQKRPGLEKVLAELVTLVVKRDKGDWYFSPPPEQDFEKGAIGGPDAAREPEHPPEEVPSPPFRPLPVGLGLLLFFAVFVYWKKRRNEESVGLHVKATHFLPTFLQTLIFSYWALYWPSLIDFLPYIGLEIIYAYVLEMSLSFLVFRRWRFSFGPLPIVLSTNLFMIFPPEQLYMPLAALTIAIGCKILIRSGGRHVFNPSALGIAVVGALNLIFPSMGYGDTAAQFNLPPNMSEILVLVVLVAQFRVPIVLVSIGAFAGMLVYGPVVGPFFPELTMNTPSPDWAPVLLVLALLLTDPATSPRTGPGRLLFGLSCGLSITIVSVALTESGLSDFYSKVIPVPLMNALVPSFDRIGARIAERVTVLKPQFNRWHIAFWVLMVTWSLHGGLKSRTFRADVHVTNQTRFINVAEGGRISCEVNPLFCEPHRLDLELACWWHAIAGSDASCGFDWSTTQVNTKPSKRGAQ